LLCEEGLELRLELLVSAGFLLFLEINFIHFAESRIMLFQEILYAAHANLDVVITGWTSNFSIVDRKLVGSPGELCINKYTFIVLFAYHGICVTNMVPAFGQMFWQAGHNVLNGNNARSWIGRLVVVQ
jgi:hypothetical protein